MRGIGAAAKPEEVFFGVFRLYRSAECCPLPLASVLPPCYILYYYISAFSAAKPEEFHRRFPPLPFGGMLPLTTC